jgi:CYTH domain-containing protein
MLGSNLANATGAVTLEIERRWLLAGQPPTLPLDATEAALTQTYLNVPGAARIRVREWRQNGHSTWFRTAKTKIADGVRREDEWPITRAEHDCLAVYLADPSRVPIKKTRWAFTDGGQRYDLDHIVAPVDLWILEAELGHRDELEEAITLPDYLVVVREITAESGWSNASLALCHEPKARRKLAIRRG